jgi:hypothetical protein
MRKIFLVLLFISPLVSFSRNFEHTQILVVDRPDTTKVNAYYISNKSPLLSSMYIKLPVGAIEPEGWLRECLYRQRDGLNGNLEYISAWLEKKDNAWLSKTGKGNWGWEEVPYWLKGYGDLAYILNDSKMIAEIKVWIDGVLNSQRPNGDFGPNHFEGGKRNFWGNMIMLYCLQSYYEFSHDHRVIDLMTGFFKYQLTIPDKDFLKGYWEGLRAGDNLYSVFWLYNRTDNPFLLDLAKKIHRCMTNWELRDTQHKEDNSVKKNPKWYELLPDWHNVNVAQGFREPAEYYQLSKDSTDLKATYEVFNIIRQYFGQVPGGMFGADEVARPGYSDPHQGIETCGMVEQMNSDETMLDITGDLFWADHVENVAFNTFPAALTSDFKALRYLTAPNMVVSDDKDHSPGVMNAGSFFMMNPFSSRCCQHNHGQGWPYYAENLWMATPDNGAFVALYVASEANIRVGDGTKVVFKEQTHYPFDDDVQIKLSMSNAVKFPLYLRIPGWCKQATIELNGTTLPVNLKAGKLVVLSRKWENGDQVKLKLPMNINVHCWTQNHNSVSVNYGPLTFSLKIKENYIKEASDATAISDSKWQQGVDKSKWPSWKILPGSAWNYGLVLNTKDSEKAFKIEKKAWPKNNFPFTPSDVPIIIKAKAKQIPEWKLDQDGLCGKLMESPVLSTQPEVEVELIPMGAARLRISAFPVVK